MELFQQLLEEASIELEKSETLRKEAEAATEKRNNLLGIARNQSVTTKGTLLQLVTSIRDVLLGAFKGILRDCKKTAN